MQKWEYCYIFRYTLCFATENGVKRVDYSNLKKERGFLLDHIAPIMAWLGSQGWEMVFNMGDWIYFKRPIVE